LTLDNQLVLPALNVSPAPAEHGGKVEFLAGPFVRDRWLSEPGDVVAARISGGPVSILLTSLRAPGAPALTIDVQKIEGRDLPTLSRAAPASRMAPVPSASDAPEGVPGVLLHIQKRGDVSFAGTSWAGDPEGLWIEAFAINPPAGVPPGDIEYRALAGNGLETPWTGGGELCGSRGMNTPLLGFAIRQRSSAAERFTCEYSGRFLSGETVGPCRNGRPCRSSSPSDPLTAIQLTISKRM
jgi:hypothetical protein